MVASAAYEQPTYTEVLICIYSQNDESFDKNIDEFDKNLQNNFHHIFEILQNMALPYFSLHCTLNRNGGLKQLSSIFFVKCKN